jgi:muramoyltetrapeptide carboxypeptidase
MTFNDKSPVARIISPSGVTLPEHLDGAATVLRSWGYRVTEGRYARASAGRFAGTDEERLYDLQSALDDPSLDLILCSRGGYGLVRIIDKLSFEGFAEHPKWVVGFSDITVLHASLNKQGFATIHGNMARYLAELPANNPGMHHLRAIPEGDFPIYRLPSHPLNRCGVAQGTLIGGNLSVLMSLRGTPFEPDYRDAILFVEDIGEQPYHIDRMLQNFRLSGVLQQLAGMIIGHFTDCPEDASMGKTIPEIILDAIAGYHYPVCFGFPAGHEEQNYPLVLGRKMKLAVGDKETVVDFN